MRPTLALLAATLTAAVAAGATPGPVVAAMPATTAAAAAEPATPATAAVPVPSAAVPVTGPAPTAAVPQFLDGQAQPVFDPARTVRDELWVSAPVDSDRDGAPDRVHVEVVRPAETVGGLRVPVVYLPSPYYAGGNPVRNHDVDVELHSPPRRGATSDAGAGADRRAAALGADPGADRSTDPGARHGTATEGDVDAAVDGTVDSTVTSEGVGAAAENLTSRYESYFVARGFAVVYAESLGSGASTGCPTSGGVNETIGATAVVDWLNGRAPAVDAAGAPVTAGWTTGSTAMMGVSYNGTLPNAVAATGVAGLDAIVPIAAISSWYDYYRAGGAVVAPGGYQGEDTDILAEYVLTRANPEVCRPVLDELLTQQDRVTGDWSPFWAERDYLRSAGSVRAATLVAHGLRDDNVRTRHAAQWYAALPASTPKKIWWHQSGHTDVLGLRRDAWLRELNRWFTRYLYKVENGVEQEGRATVQREDGTWHVEADWPAPGTADVTLSLGAGGGGVGPLALRRPGGAAGPDRFVDDATLAPATVAAAASSPHRLRYDTTPATGPVRLSGTVRANLGVTVHAAAANVTALLVDRAPDGTVKIITRGWTDPQNRSRIDRTVPIRPGQALRLHIELQPDDYLLPAGHRLGLVVLSSDRDHTLRPTPGTRLEVDPRTSWLTVPITGGLPAARAALTPPG